MRMKSKNLIDSFNNAINGIVYSVKNERNMKIHVISAVFVLLMSLVFPITKEQFLIVCITVAFVIICELINTAIEALVDIVTDKYHPKAKVVKDVAAGAVLVSAFISIIVGYFIFFDKISRSLEQGIRIVRQTPIHVTAIALVVTMLLVLVLKSIIKTGTPMQGGMPSGHAAISFSIATAIALWTDNVEITLLCLIMAGLVFQSRLEGKIHSVIELAAGAVLGVLTTLLLFNIFG